MIVQPTKKQVSQVKSIQAPTGGLNAKDPIADMKETEAVTMENWFPQPSSVDIRNGYAEHATGISGATETLAVYNNGVTKELFAACNGSIYDVTSSGAVGAAVVSGMTNSRFQNIIMGTAGGIYLLMVNGADKMRIYNGTTWDYDGGGTYTITGVNTANCAHINNFKNRIWLIEKDTMNAWYLPVSSIAGSASKLDLSGLFKLGGYLMAMCNWTIDNAAGIDDYAAFITSEGEVALYKGTDPSSSTTWAIVGTFRMGKPIGRRCFTKAGADVLIVTSDGAFPISKALLTDRTQMALAATDKIQRLVNADIQNYKSNFGWQPIIYPLGNKLIINVPVVENTQSYQYVMNTIHGAWTKFTGWTGYCWEVLDDVLYFGGTDGVFKADYGADDNGGDINTVCQQAFSYFGTKQQKLFKMARPVFLANGDINPAVLMNTDFAQNRTTVSPSFTSNTGSSWDTSPWDTSPWTYGDNLIKKWQTVTGVGYSGGLRVVTATQNLTLKWQATDVLFEVGGVI